MKLVSNGSFDSHQQALTEAILHAIKTEIEAVDAPAEIVEQLTGRIAFAVTSLLDGVAPVELGSGTASPMLTFLVEDGALEFGGGNSWMHEYVYRLLPKTMSERDNP
jgi:hypothetical protein